MVGIVSEVSEILIPIAATMYESEAWVFMVICKRRGTFGQAKSTERQSQSLQQHGPATPDSENIEPKAKSFVHTSVQARIETPQLILHLSSNVLENGNLASERATPQSTHGNAEKSVHQLDEEFQKFCEISKSVYDVRKSPAMT
ncbi:uncharacterized protein LOC112346503 [Selaginella moellendorffii]|uniref:uncharacterized protein LOC112346503 n=1 Tax=Selaginella moellendorffii TaxID=88036 RepID=UPI000D1C2E49|nr:uncharacterized protein LOC112346503 [Selaginella moellendorffii]XP_024531343.1 uncharacterized protein LOC112346503 [Selaginella moellendorffii]|eukprot:XP_024531342.1 uncharacterized protein LOC112346503 [Selaginella moellendorffii]